MFSLRYQLISKLVTILILVAILFSCTHKKTIVFHYSNGVTIKDSVLIQFLNKQLPVRVPEYDSTQSMDVQTCFDKGIETKLNGYFRKDSLREVSAMVVIENKTGNVVYCRNSEDLFIYSQRLQNMKMYGVLMSFENGVKLTDAFSWTGKFSGRKYEQKISSLYRMIPPTVDYKYPFDTYSCSQWTRFLDKLEVLTKESDCADGDWFPRFYFRTSLFDLVKTGAVVSRNGSVKSNNLFGVIKSPDGRILHSPDFAKGRLLEPESCYALKTVFKRNPSKDITFNYPISLHTDKGFRNGMVFSTEKITIGFVSCSKSVDNAEINKEIAVLASLF